MMVVRTILLIFMTTLFAPSASAEDKILRIGLAAEPTSMDPHFQLSLIHI